MAVTHKAIVSLFHSRAHGIQSLAARYKVPMEYVEDVLMKHIWGRKIEAKGRRSRSRQITLAERYGTIQV